MIVQYVRQFDTSNLPVCPVETGTILEALRASAERLGLPITFHPYQQETPVDLQTIRAWLERTAMAPVSPHVPSRIGRVSFPATEPAPGEASRGSAMNEPDEESRGRTSADGPAAEGRGGHTTQETGR
jgi:hypothetical protein